MSTAESFEYGAIGPGEQLQVVESRLQQYELEHYSHALNRMALVEAEDVSDDDRAVQLEQIDRTLASIERSIALHRRERERLVGAGGSRNGDG
jgi:hypothetical protein